jgi:glyoxylase-like metal-dependent hydrolase (beta-lactamase superfamily II)
MTQSESRLSRRSMLKLTAAASAVAASAASQAHAADLAQSGTPPTNGAGFYRFKIGEFTGIVFSDGQAVSNNSPFPNWGANPGRQAEFEQTLKDNFIPVTPFVNNFNPMLIDTGKNRVLIDTGFGLAGAQNNTGKLLAHLKSAGYKPTDIDTVFITHGHGDHIQGLTDAKGKMTFSRAQHLMGEAEFNQWVNGANPNAAVKKNLVDVKGNFTLVQPNQEIVPGVRTLPSPGHTRNHLAILAASGSEQLIHLGDAGGHYVLSFKFPDHYLGFDADPAVASQSRKAIFERATTERMMVVGYHFAWPGVGYIKRDGNAYAFQPAFWRFA